MQTFLVPPATLDTARLRKQYANSDVTHVDPDE